MDDVVKQAMAKWPNVPAVYGWLSLDRRGRWLIKGERISNPVISNFISRNYAQNAEGCWYFQNGPQRVFITLDYTPFVFHVEWAVKRGAPLHIKSHVGSEVTHINRAWIDDEGVLLLDSAQGIGMMDDRDLEQLLPHFTDVRGTALTEEAIEAALEKLQAGNSAGLYFHYHDKPVQVCAIKSREAPGILGFVQHPVQPEGQEKC